MTGDLEWDGAVPRSRLYDDVYFSASDGLAESRAVFLTGAGLPERWTERRRFRVAELGFGTGLNIAALLDLWRLARPPGGHLSIFSIEGHPIDAASAERALAHWPQVSQAAAPLLAGWPDGRRGMGRVDLPGLDATLDLWIGEALPGLHAWSGLADAWFLDGFAPSRNPQMWSDAVLAAIAARSAPGARVATYTVAGQVRRGLAAAGFTVARHPGFGRKRERLEAVLGGDRSQTCDVDVLVIGAGIAGAALAWALRAQGLACRVLDARGVGGGASGNPAALVSPRLDAGFGAAAKLHAQAFARAAQVYRALGDAVVAQGALQLAATPRDPDRFARIAAWDGYGFGRVATLQPAQAAAELTEAEAPPALAFADALTVAPAQVLRGLIGETPVDAAQVSTLTPDPSGGWTCLGPEGHPVAHAAVACLAAGSGLGAFLPRQPLRQVRGQMDFTEAVAFTGAPAAWGGYALPLPHGGVAFGASHVRDDPGCDVRAADSIHNLTQLAKGRPALARRIAQSSTALSARAGVRVATPDHMPIAGAIAPGLYGLGALGGRGFALAPLLAEQIVALISGAPSPLPAELARAVSPDRFKDAAPPAD